VRFSCIRTTTQSIGGSAPETADAAESGDAFAAGAAALALFAAPRRVRGALLRAMVGPLYTRAAEFARPLPPHMADMISSATGLTGKCRLVQSATGSTSEWNGELTPDYEYLYRVTGNTA
jgi:hypothetical protein